MMSIFRTVNLNTLGFAFVMCTFGGVETHNSFIFHTSIIVLFINRLVKRRKTLWFCCGISRKRAVVWLRRCSAPRRPRPHRLNASNHLSDLIRGGMKQAILINADLNGWMDGPPPPPPPPPHHHHQYHQHRPPLRRRRPAGIFLHIGGLQSANGCSVEGRWTTVGCLTCTWTHRRPVWIQTARKQETRGKSCRQTLQHV